MLYCPNCSCPLESDEGDCPKCGALFGSRADWTPTTKPSGPVPQRPTRTSPKTIIDNTPEPTKAEAPYEPGLIGWANLSLAIAFTLSFHLSPGAKALRLFVDLPVLQSIPVHQAHILNAFANYWILAVCIYVVLRLTKVESWLRPRRAIQSMLGTGNALLILYLIPRIFASTIEGGGASFVVATFSPFLVIPAQVLFLIGLVWLVARSISKRKDAHKVQIFYAYESAALIVAVVIPMVYIAKLTFGENAPFRMAREAGKLFESKCHIAGERILRVPTEAVRGLYLEQDGSDRYETIKEGVYNGSGSGILGEPLVNSGQLMFVEKPNNRPRKEDDGQFKYRRHGFKDWKGQPVNELESEYGMYRKDLTSEAERKLGIRGAEVTIKDLRTNETVATTTYFVSSRHRKFCGHAPNGSFDGTQFVKRALDLQKRYPSAWDTQKPK